MRYSGRSWGIRRGGLIGLGLVAMLVVTTGLSCDSDAANTFRKTATGPIGEGVKTIADGVIDGMIASIKNAGDDVSTSTSTKAIVSSGH